MSTTVGAHSGAGPLSLMSCVRESSPLQDFEPDIEKNVVSKRKFWNPKKWFRKKQKTGDDAPAYHQQEHRDGDGSRSRSTGELSTDEEPSRSNEVRNTSTMHPGLSVSHDSVFHPLNSGSSDLELDGAQSSSSLSISQPLGDAKLQTELSSRLRLRRGRGDTSEDDEGFPRSPPCGSPAAAADSFLIIEKTANKDLPTKSHSTCSDGSLLSMDSSEIDEDSVGLHSRHSSKVSLNEKRIDLESDLELGPSFLTTPLNHSAAHHRVSVRPKRTYGAPRRKKGQLSTALPATPEVNEDYSTRSISPESITTEPITELYTTSRRIQQSALTHETKLKCNSLPAGVAPPKSDSFRLGRSKSNAGKSQDDTDLPREEREEKLSLFERIFPRRSAKKKKKDERGKMEVDGARISEEKAVLVFSTTPTTTKTYTETKTVTTSSHSHIRREDTTKPIVAPRTGAASRQRIQPIDIPVTPKEIRDSISSVPKSPLSPDSSFGTGTSPIHVELENILRQRQISQVPPSPKDSILDTPPQSPRSPKLSASSVISRTERTSYTARSNYLETTKWESKTNFEDIRSKVKIAGLSSLQQRVLGLSNDPSDDLSEFSARPTKPVSKSHSFKSQKTTFEKPLMEVDEDVTENRKSVIKAASLDSIKNLEEPVLKSELQLILTSPLKALEKENELEVEEIEIRAEKSPLEIIEVTATTDGSGQTSIHESEEKPPKTTSQGHVPKDTHQEDTNSYTTSTYSSKSVEEHGVKSSASTEPIIDTSFCSDSITISGPSHTAVVNVTSKSEDFSKTSAASENEITENDGSKTVIYKENQVSVTKIQLKHETTQVTRTSVVVPEFLSKQLNKVEIRPTSNIILSMKSPKTTAEEQQNARPKTLFNFPSSDLEPSKPSLPRKFSKEDVEIIEKDNPESKDKDSSPPKTPTLISATSNQSRFKKNDSKPSSRKSSVISITPELPVKDAVRDKSLKTRSISLDSLKSDQNKDSTPDKSSQDSLDKMEKRSFESVVLRRKSLAKQKNDDEPELMKVFARRSLKLKDSDVEQIQEAIAEEQRQRDSDKENSTDFIPEQEKTTPYGSKVEKNTLHSPKEETIIIEDLSETKNIVKQPLTEIKKTSSDFIKNIAKEESEVQLRKTLNNNVFLAAQRAVSLNTPKTILTDFHIKKQSSLNERRKTDQWITAKQEEIQEKKSESEIITNISTKTDEIRTETKNFSQRRAEWEKRVQQSQK